MTEVKEYDVDTRSASVKTKDGVDSVDVVDIYYRLHADLCDIENEQHRCYLAALLTVADSIHCLIKHKK